MELVLICSQVLCIVFCFWAKWRSDRFSKYLKDQSTNLKYRMDCNKRIADLLVAEAEYVYEGNITMAVECAELINKEIEKANKTF